MKEWMRHPITALENRRNDRLIMELMDAIADRPKHRNEHEIVRRYLGWSARRFDVVTDLAVDIGLIEYDVQNPALLPYGERQQVHYFLTDSGAQMVKRQGHR